MISYDLLKGLFPWAAAPGSEAPGREGNKYKKYVYARRPDQSRCVDCRLAKMGWLPTDALEASSELEVAIPKGGMLDFEWLAQCGKSQPSGLWKVWSHICVISETTLLSIGLLLPTITPTTTTTTTTTSTTRPATTPWHFLGFLKNSWDIL